MGRQFDLADNGFAQRASLNQRRRIYRHAGADHNKILPVKSALAVSSGFNCNAVVEQDGNGFPQLIWRLGIADGYARPVRFQKQGGSHARLAQADD